MILNKKLRYLEHFSINKLCILRFQSLENIKLNIKLLVTAIDTHFSKIFSWNWKLILQKFNHYLLEQK